MQEIEDSFTGLHKKLTSASYLVKQKLTLVKIVFQGITTCFTAIGAYIQWIAKGATLCNTKNTKKMGQKKWQKSL